MDLTELNAQPRTRTGNGPARALRREGRIPAVFYGTDIEPTLLSVSIADLEDCLKRQRAAQAVFNLKLADGSEQLAMLKELQADPLSGNYLHADFYRIHLDRKVAARVPVNAYGKSKGVEMGGRLQIIRRELEVFCLPKDIPKTIDIDITNLGVGDAVHVEDVKLAGDIEIPHDVNFTVMTVLGTRKTEAAARLEEVEDGFEDEGQEAAEASEAEA